MPLPMQLFLKGFGLGGSLGALVAIVNVVGYLRAPSGEMIELGAYWALLLGFPLSLGVGPFLMFAPWVWMVLLPAMNFGLIGVTAVLLYHGMRWLPFFRD